MRIHRKQQLLNLILSQGPAYSAAGDWTGDLGLSQENSDD
jgi:hypothetical protein